MDTLSRGRGFQNAEGHNLRAASLFPFRFLQRVKGLTSRKLLEEYKSLKKGFWGRHLWARGCFVAPTGNVTDEAIAKSIEEQNHKERDQDDEFKVES